MDYFSGHETEFLSLSVGIFALLLAVMVSLSLKYVAKPVHITLILISAISSYFMDTYGVFMSHGMIRNVVETTVSESSQLITGDFISHMALFGFLPSALIAWVKISYRSFFPSVVHNGIVVIACTIIAGGSVGFNYSLNASVIGNNHDLLGSLNPVAPIAAVVRYMQIAVDERGIEIASLGEDARLGPQISASEKPVLTVIVVGETARSQNFSLNGYDRQTDPELARRNVISFSHTTSCDTSTAVSVPCMFSVFGRDDFTSYEGLANENLLDVLQRAGLNVAWWENNSGHKGVAARVDFENLAISDLAPYCYDNECNDGILAAHLERYLDTIENNTVLVLHQIGSHGPTYYRRYPPEFEKFTPTCKTNQLADCTVAEITNTYDNTILFTDHVLARIIDLLKARDNKLHSSMIYMSDHGESLGEYGLYFHGTPYLIAPETQKRIPFILWMSSGFVKTMQLDQTCVDARKDRELSHDNLFHSVLGAMNVLTEIYQPTHDIFAGCRRVAGL